jgi:hypothetical protein
VVVALGILPAVATGATPTDARVAGYRFHYTSPYTGLQYDYDTRTGVPGGDVTSFRLSTEAGDLIGTILVGDLLSRIVLIHAESGLRAVLDFVKADVPGRGNVHLSFPERDEDAYFKADEAAADGVTFVSRVGPDCASLLSTGLLLAVEDAIRTLAADADLSPNPPAHLQQISAAVFFSRSLVDRLDGCRRAQDPAAGRCHLDYEDYLGCRQCCEEDAALLAVMCKVGSNVVCKGPWCKALRKVFCGGLMEFHEGVCVTVMCNGKTGDPNCPPEQLCGEVEGSSCWEFCGITRKSVCGKCPPRQDCCAPM